MKRHAERLDDWFSPGSLDEIIEVSGHSMIKLMDEVQQDALDHPPEGGHIDHTISAALTRLEHAVKQIEERTKKIMIDQATFDKSLAADTAATQAAIAALQAGGGPPSTPDAVVSAYIAGVDNNTAHLQAAVAPPAPTPTPQPPTP